MSSPTSPKPPVKATPDSPADHSDHHTQGHVGHAMPMVILAGVFAVLMVLTGLTVAATWIDLGEANIWIALGIAFVKAVLVCLYFMHLRYDSPFNSLVVAAALAFVVLFVGVALLDSQAYQPNIRAAGPQGPPASALTSP